MTNLPSYYLEELLKNYGTVEPDKKVSGEKKEIDILFTPSANQTYDLELLGVIGRFAEYPAILEPFRNPASADEICDCVIKVLEVKAGIAAGSGSEIIPNCKKRKYPNYGF